MRGGALPPALLCAAIGFALAFAPRRLIALCLGLLLAGALATGFVRFDPSWRDGIFYGCWISIVVTALAVHRPGGLGPRTAMVLAGNAGLWSGAVIAAAGAPADLARALPWALLCVPGAWLVAAKRQIVIKVIASWLIAVAVLAAAIPITTPTPGYVPDHMD